MGFRNQSGRSGELSEEHSPAIAALLHRMLKAARSLRCSRSTSLLFRFGKAKPGAGAQENSLSDGPCSWIGGMGTYSPVLRSAAPG
jgi:hypothetical protein